jgi:hypothetical protein
MSSTGLQPINLMHSNGGVAGGVSQVIEHLPSKHGALSSKLNTTKGKGVR